MKGFKLKSILLSLAYLMALSFIIISCEKNTNSSDLLEKEKINLNTKFDNATIFTLSTGHDNKNMYEIENYLTNLTHTELEILAENKPEFRGACGPWRNIGPFKRRWCGPPGSGAYEYKCTRITNYHTH